MSRLLFSQVYCSSFLLQRMKLRDPERVKPGLAEYKPRSEAWIHGTLKIFSIEFYIAPQKQNGSLQHPQVSVDSAWYTTKAIEALSPPRLDYTTLTAIATAR